MENKQTSSPIDKLVSDHLSCIVGDVIPMTDEWKAKEHGDISIRFAIEMINLAMDGGNWYEVVNELESKLLPVHIPLKNDHQHHKKSNKKPLNKG